MAGFGDVGAGRFYTDAVQWMVDNDITTGVSPNCFCPDDPVTRGQAAAFMWRM
ncbi:MAG: S-layer homology domain-containing protein, partial [Actinobacteria bacterium]|nr:S-layer homology domain-containing protein [Actinomycetota bacterium]NIS29383.1 S-layer homology domain-containing protein [Actinomycetota bacterium]NIT94490.1 S-layer homology domain-containing protein [Actinomycetota bacterium]NIU18105.1 S-layer homology domain-containing protein [Actinomycetota bacterium]NIU64745.1 S-layer homology domain-containing protein [Actinomycetota bacterium]